MTKTLQKRFVMTAMIAVSVLLVVLLGTINGVNCVLTEQQTGRLLEMLSENEGRPELPGLRPQREPGRFWEAPINEDTAMSARFFVVRLDDFGQVMYTDVNHISSVTQDQAANYARQAVAKGDGGGTVDQFKYQVSPARDGRGVVVVFLSVSGQLHSMLTVLLLSLCVGGICWGLMLLLVILLSRKAIAPIAQNMERQKQFVTDAGHEIKTPLAIILANTDAMELHNGENKWSRNIRSQTLRLNGLMQNLLTLARMDEGVSAAKASNVSLSLLVEETLQPFYEAAALRGISIQTDIQPQVQLRADREHIERLISILLDNAVKYSDSNGQISVILEQLDRKIRFQVKNPCSQLPQAEPQRLFDRFYRGDSARTQKSGGYGIGLSAAQAIVEEQGGNIRAEYKNGNSVVFTVTL